MRFRGARDNTMALIVGIIVVLIAIAAIWFFFYR